MLEAYNFRFDRLTPACEARPFRPIRIQSCHRGGAADCRRRGAISGPSGRFGRGYLRYSRCEKVIFLPGSRCNLDLRGQWFLTQREDQSGVTLAPMPVRILHVATRHRVGGAERNLLHTISRELDRGFDVHMAVGAEDLRDDLPAQVRLHPLPDLVRELSPLADRRALRSLRAVIHKHEFDVVHTHQSKAGALGRMAARQSAAVVVHTVHMASFGPAYPPAHSLAFLHAERRLARFTDQFIFVGTDLLRRYLAARVTVPERSIVVRSPIPNLAALIELRDNRVQPRQRGRSSIGVALDGQMILMVGALDRRKRHALAITSLAPLLLSGHAVLVVVGEGHQRDNLRDLCARLRIEDSVRFPGFVHDVTSFYAAADVLVQVSKLEGVPQTVVQAVAAGVPVVATDMDGVREAAPDGPHVSILPPDGDGLLAAVRAALAGPCPPPVREELLEQWIPTHVDAQLDAFHQWLEARIEARRSALATTPRVARKGPPSVAPEERVPV
jgi:glycosyltransferase involved in cell wall biosynthesis